MMCTENDMYGFFRAHGCIRMMVHTKSTICSAHGFTFTLFPCVEHILDNLLRTRLTNTMCTTIPVKSVCCASGFPYAVHTDDIRVQHTPTAIRV